MTSQAHSSSSVKPNFLESLFRRSRILIGIFILWTVSLVACTIMSQQICNPILTLGYLFKPESVQWVSLVVLAFILFTVGWNPTTLFPQSWFEQLVLYSPAYHYGQLIAWIGQANFQPIFRFDNYPLSSYPVLTMVDSRCRGASTTGLWSGSSIRLGVTVTIQAKSEAIASFCILCIKAFMNN
jgi:hypothetical protein